MTPLRGTGIRYVWVNKDGSTTRWRASDADKYALIVHRDPPVIVAIDAVHRCQIKAWRSEESPHVKLAFHAAQSQDGLLDRAAMDNCVSDDLVECVLNAEIYDALNALMALPDRILASGQIVQLLLRLSNRHDLANEVQRQLALRSMPMLVAPGTYHFEVVSTSFGQSRMGSPILSMTARVISPDWYGHRSSQTYSLVHQPQRLQRFLRATGLEIDTFTDGVERALVGKPFKATTQTIAMGYPASRRFLQWVNESAIAKVS